jgi:hypothetical protein
MCLPKVQDGGSQSQFSRQSCSPSLKRSMFWGGPMAVVFMRCGDDAAAPDRGAKKPHLSPLDNKSFFFYSVFVVNERSGAADVQVDARRNINRQPNK